MQKNDFCLRAQTLGHDYEEVFWDGREFLVSNSSHALEYLNISDFIYSNGVVWYSMTDLRISLHSCGWAILEINPVEKDKSGRFAPVIVVANFKVLDIFLMRNYFNNIPIAIGRTFSGGVLDRACDQLEILIKRGSGLSFLLILSRYFFLKYFRGEK